MKKTIVFLLFILFQINASTYAQTGVSSPLTINCDTAVQNFMTRWGIPGGIAAITRNGKLVYSRAFGTIDQAGTQIAQPYNLLRVASLSKMITATAIMRLYENGQLSLTDTVFGPHAILNSNYYLSAITDSRIYNITIQNLLEHNSGWDRAISCDGFSTCDPPFFPLHVDSVLEESDPVGDTALIKFLLLKGLDHNPGTTYAYSNVGYEILGRVIEAKTGMKYEDYIQSTILNPLGICDMHLGKTLLQNKQEREGEYNDVLCTSLDCFGNNTTVPCQYGSFHLEATDADGGWISTAKDYIRLIAAIDSFPSPPDILSPATIHMMVTPSIPYQYQAKGWSVNTYHDWWKDGGLPGTSSFIERTRAGYVWTFIFNSRGNNSTAFNNQLGQIGWNCYYSTASWPTFDLFSPSQNVSALLAAPVSSSSVKISWTNGNGNKRIIVARQGQPVTDYPSDGVDYAADSTFGIGTNIGNNTFVVYNSTGNNVTVSNLFTDSTYYFEAFEYYKNTNTGNYSVYTLGCSPSITVIPAEVGIAKYSLSTKVIIYPNPTNGQFTIETNTTDKLNMDLYDVNGKKVLSKNVVGTANIDVSNLDNGVYTLTIKNNAGTSYKKIIITH